jgi:hypothetical protein
MKGSRKGKWFSAFTALCVVVGCSVLLSSPAAAGTSPNVPPDDSGKQAHDSVTIGANNEFNPANAVRSGMGTRKDPFVISGWEIDTIRIHDTSRWVVVKDNVITGTLILDWIGHRVTVKNNTIEDLRVNQNVERTGMMTDGTIVHNEFGSVGQLRHWDGVFAHNVVGTPDSMWDGVPFAATEAVNFDGFNGAHFRNNTIYGFVDATLHGHHHSTGYGHKSHDHFYTPPEEGQEGEHAEHAHHHMHGGMDMPNVDHTKRWHEVFISNNKIYSSGPFALRYNDLNHAANDRTANSETDPALEEPHVHHTKVFMTNNKLYGSGLAVEVFNADDDHHLKIAHGTVVIRNNTIDLTRPTGEFFSSLNGISVDAAQVLTLKISGNTVKETVAETNAITHDADNDAGIWLNNLDQANVYIAKNQVTDLAYGVFARELSKTVNWWINGLQTTRVATPVYYDNSVANQPRRNP